MGGWSRQRVKIILDNPAYAGFRIYEGREFPAMWEPLVSRETWEKAKTTRHQARSTYVDPPGYRNHLLSGLIVCGLCGKNLHFGRQNDRGGTYRCTNGDDRPPRCLGGPITAERAEEWITGAYFEVAAMTKGIVDNGAGSLEMRWGRADLFGRRALLSEAIDKVVLLPRPVGNRHSKGTPIGRSLRVEWTNRWSLAAFGYVGATSTLTPKDQRITSPRGKSWDEWRKARLMPHSIGHLR